MFAAHTVKPPAFSGCSCGTCIFARGRCGKSCSITSSVIRNQRCCWKLPGICGEGHQPLLETSTQVQLSHAQLRPSVGCVCAEYYASSRLEGGGGRGPHPGPSMKSSRTEGLDPHNLWGIAAAPADHLPLGAAGRTPDRRTSPRIFLLIRLSISLTRGVMVHFANRHPFPLGTTVGGQCCHYPRHMRELRHAWVSNLSEATVSEGNIRCSCKIGTSPWCKDNQPERVQGERRKNYVYLFWKTLESSDATCKEPKVSRDVLGSAGRRVRQREDTAADAWRAVPGRA